METDDGDVVVFGEPHRSEPIHGTSEARWQALLAVIAAARAYLDHTEYEHSLPAYFRLHPKIAGGWKGVQAHWEQRSTELREALYDALAAAERREAD